jgi:hypothetical protein
MKNILYYISLLILIALLTGFLLSGQSTGMSMSQMVSVSAFLVLYTIALSLVGEGHTLDERQILHRNLSNRAGLVAGTIILSIGVLYQLYTHHIDFWLLAGLIAINLTKIVGLIYLEMKK